MITNLTPHPHAPYSWNLRSWRDFPIQQHPTYPNPQILLRVEEALQSKPPLVPIEEIRMLHHKLSDVALGKAFILQGGDCAESFDDASVEHIDRYVHLISQMTILLCDAIQQPVVTIGRVAGQYAKPRTYPKEYRDSHELPHYRGDLINDITFDATKRTPNPERMLDAYDCASKTIQWLKSSKEQLTNHCLDATYWKNLKPSLSIHHPCILEILESPTRAALLEDHLITPEKDDLTFFCSHEALLLHYEEALTRLDPTTQRMFDSSGHFLWIGERTRNLDEAHIEFIRGISNPIAVKLSANITPDELLRLVNHLNPDNIPGKLTLITRMGYQRIASALPKLVQYIAREEKQIIWMCDPMHANTEFLPSGHKTRRLQHITQEIQSFIEILKCEKLHAGGIHLEITGKDVTECIGGTQNITALDLPSRYNTNCDPRLNASQSLEVAEMIARLIRKA